MNPLMKNKVDVSTLSEEEKKLFERYGKLPPKKNALMTMQRERKYFDSGDYAMQKAGVTPEQNVGTAIPTPESLPHASPPSLSSSPTNTPTSPGLHAVMSSIPIPSNAGHSLSASGNAASGGIPTLASLSSAAGALSPSAGHATPIPAAGGSHTSNVGTHTAGTPSPPTLLQQGVGVGASHSMDASNMLHFEQNQGGAGVGRKPSVSGMGGIAIPGSSGSFSDGARVSPPVSFSQLQSTNQPSSFPIQNSLSHGSGHHHSSSIGHGNSPVKPSGLAMGMNNRGNDKGASDEMAVDDS